MREGKGVEDDCGGDGGDGEVREGGEEEEERGRKETRGRLESDDTRNGMRGFLGGVGGRRCNEGCRREETE